MKLIPGQLTFTDIKQALASDTKITLNAEAYQNINDAAQIVQNIITNKKTVYGINTGFGLLADTTIAEDQLAQLQNNIVLSHAAGVGECLAPDIVKLILLLKINSLAQGNSGITKNTLDTLIAFYNNGIYPCVPKKGSVGASGDLAPLAHLCCPLIGVGEVCFQGERQEAKKALKKVGIEPLQLQPKEGLALLNGVQVSNAIALYALMQIENLFNKALIIGSMTLDAAMGSTVPFDERIHQVRGHRGQIECAAIYRKLLAGSQIRDSHHACNRVQDPYSLRCQPQVMGACLDQIRFAAHTLVIEANAVSDNPLVFPQEGDILSGGNFHGEPVAMACDNLAIALAEIGALSERRMALLIDKNISLLPPFLVENSGVNSGFMMAQVTSAALASENKSLAHPASIDSLPTSANQEDHVSMATYAANRLLPMCENTDHILTIELLAACQGIDFRLPLVTSTTLQEVLATVRAKVPFYQQDRLFADDINALKSLQFAHYINF